MGKILKFKIKIEGKGKLWRVKFYPEKQKDTPVPLKAATNNKKFYNDGFLVEVDNPFEYELIVTGPQNTKWEGTLKTVNKDGEEQDFIKWSGKTGDGDGSNGIDETSIRKKPTKDIQDEKDSSATVILAAIRE